MRLELGHMKVLPSVSVVKALLKLVLLTLVLPCRTAGASDVLFIETRLNSNNISCTSSCSNAESWDLGQQNITRRTPEQDGGDALDPRLPIWTLRNENGSIIVPARAPGSVHLDLLAAGVLDSGDPYFGDNELTYSWVARADWIYTLSLPRAYWMEDDLEAAVGGGGGRGRRGNASELVGLLTFEGVDTFASVRLNGREIGRCSNQYTPATFVLRGKGALRELLEKEASTIEVTVHSALRKAREAAAASPQEVPDMVFYQDWAEPAHRNFARKAASDFGWDWGPAFMPAGLSGSVSLTITNVGRLLPDVAITQDWSRSRKISSRRGESTSAGRATESAHSARSDSDYGDEYHSSSSSEGSDSDWERQQNGYNNGYSNGNGDGKKGGENNLAVVLLTVTAFLDGFQRGDDRKSASGATSSTPADATDPDATAPLADPTATLADATDPDATVDTVGTIPATLLGNRGSFPVDHGLHFGFMFPTDPADPSVGDVLDGMAPNISSGNPLGALRLTLSEPSGHSGREREGGGGAIVAESCAPVVADGAGDRPCCSAEDILPVAVDWSVAEDPSLLWWPRGLGPQPLYTLRVEWYPGTDGTCPPLKDNTSVDDADCNGDGPVTVVTRKIGLRRISLVREPRSVGKRSTISGDRDHGPEEAEATGGRGQFFGVVGESVAEMLDVVGRISGNREAVGEIDADFDSDQEVLSASSRFSGAHEAAGELESGQEVLVGEISGDHRESIGNDLKHLFIDAKESGGDIGETMYFEINGVPVFVRGTNWIPPDAWRERVSDERRRWLLESAAAANMNMIRVWGGGQTQPRSFYAACDELGLMVWQDLPYACALYPTEGAAEENPGDAQEGGESFALPLLEAAARETRAFVRRLSGHPSVVCWGGNNEVEQALGWFNVSSGSERSSYERDYVTLFVDTIGQAVHSVDPFTPFVDSSPSNGLGPRLPSSPLNGPPGDVPTEVNSQGGHEYLRRYRTGLAPAQRDGKRWGDPNDPRFGDVHFYDYDMDCEEAGGYPSAGFVSEHGVQSFPSLDSYKQVTEPRDRWIGSPALAFRQRHEGGDGQMSRQMRRHFDFRISGEAERALGRDSGEEDSLRSYLLLSQIQQGLCLETAIRKWRTRSPGVMAMGGVLYWQLADTWQGPSWSTIEYDGSWKASHYFVRRAFASTVITGTVSSRPHSFGDKEKGAKDSMFLCQVTSDLEEGVAGTFEVSVYRWDGECDPVASWRGNVSLPGPGSVKAFEAEVEDLRSIAGADRFIVHTVFEETGRRESRDDVRPTATRKVESVRYLSTGAAAGKPVTVEDLPEARLSWEVVRRGGKGPEESKRKGDETVWTVRIRSTSHAPLVSLRVLGFETDPQHLHNDGSSGDGEAVDDARNSGTVRSPPSPQGDPIPKSTVHVDDGGFHMFPCRVHNVQIHSRARDCCAERGKGGRISGHQRSSRYHDRDMVPSVRVDSLRDLLVAIESGEHPESKVAAS